MIHWLFHKWGKWYNITVSGRKNDPNIPETLVLQERECSICGRKQRKWLL